MRSCPDDGSSFSNGALNFACNMMGFPRVNPRFPLPDVEKLDTILEHSVSLTTTLAPTFILTGYLSLSICLNVTVSNTHFLFCLKNSISLPHRSTPPRGPRRPHYRGFTITLRHATLITNPLYERSARCADLYLTTHDILKQHPFAPAGFEPVIPESERP